eukprot:4979542-Alexandrium_andersonii.AAC.1
MAQQGQRRRAPSGWTGPEDHEMVDATPEYLRVREYVRAGTNERAPEGWDTYAYVPTSDPLVDRQ